MPRPLWEEVPLLTEKSWVGGVNSQGVGLNHEPHVQQDLLLMLFHPGGKHRGETEAQSWSVTPPTQQGRLLGSRNKALN